MALLLDISKVENLIRNDLELRINLLGKLSTEYTSMLFEPIFASRFKDLGGLSILPKIEQKLYEYESVEIRFQSISIGVYENNIFDGAYSNQCLLISHSQQDLNDPDFGTKEFIKKIVKTKINNFIDKHTKKLETEIEQLGEKIIEGRNEGLRINQLITQW